MSHDYIHGCDALLEEMEGCYGDDDDDLVGKIAQDIADVHYEIVGGYVHGCDVLGEDVIPKVQTYTDKATVLSVQRALKEAGYDPGPLDGVFGPKTSAAISKMQGDAGLTPTGAVDYSVVMALKEHGVLAPPTSAAPVFSPAPSLTPAAAFAMTAPLVGPSAKPSAPPVGLLQRPVWQLALGGIGIFAVGVGLLAAIVRR